MEEASEKKSGMMLRLLIICLFQLALASFSAAQIPATPIITCASTDDVTGAVMLDWQVSTQSGINFYKIYRSNTATGPFTSILFQNDGSLAKQIAGINGNAQRYYFYMRSFSTNDSSASSAIVSNIFLIMENTPPPFNNGTAIISWNAFDSSLPGTYHILRTDPKGRQATFSATGSSYRDTITSPYCDVNTNLSYRVEYKGLCISNSNIRTGVFIDNNIPVDPVMDSVSIDPTGHLRVSWVPSVSNDVAGYEIRESPNWIPPIGYVPGKLSTLFTSKLTNACDAVRSYAVQTLDQCKNISSGLTRKPSNALNIMKIENKDLNQCKGTALIMWNAYLNMKPALGEYQVYRSVNSSVFKKIGSTRKDITSYTDTLGFTIGVNYTYFVRAVSQDRHSSSSSCKTEVTFTSLPRPDTLSLTYASVTPEQTIKMGIRFGPLETVKTLSVLRSVAANGPFNAIATFPRGNTADVVYDDTTSAINLRSYYYKIDALDKCGAINRSSGLTRTIFLTCHTNSDESHSLSWNAYEGWPGGIDHYEIYRFVNDVPDPANPITKLTGITTYTDPPATSPTGNDVVSYYVKAIEADVNVRIESNSNTVLARQQPLVLLPNAFVPRGMKNNRFRPVMDYFVDEGNYQLMVYNKWWQQVFISRDKSIGWDGKFNGEYAPGGIYYYRLDYKSLTGNSYSKTGVVLLVE